MSTKIESFDYKKFKKGCTVVVKDARRSGVIDGKQGFIETRLDNVQVSVLYVQSTPHGCWCASS